MLVERSRSDETTAAVIDVDSEAAVAESADGGDSRDPDAIGGVDPSPVSDGTGSTPAALEVTPIPLASTVTASEAPALPLTSPTAGVSAAEMEVVPAIEPCPAGSPTLPSVAVS